MLTDQRKELYNKFKCKIFSPQSRSLRYITRFPCFFRLSVNICEGKRGVTLSAFLKVSGVKGGEKFRSDEEFEALFCSERSEGDSRR